jgi:hypothetical protein
MPRLAQGLMARQRDGAWRTTTANLLASLAMEKFSRRYERAGNSGKTRLSLEPGGVAQTYAWPPAGAAAGGAVRASGARIGAASGVKAPVDIPVVRYFEPWTSNAGQTLAIEHQGLGQGWATVRSMAAVPVVKPVMAGYELQRQVTPVSQAVPGQWTRGDVYRVRLHIVARTATTWAVLSDPVPAGATILGSGLGRDSAIAAGDASEDAASADREGQYSRPPSFVERSFDSMRAYYDYLPQGETSLEYTVRLNTVGQFQLPPTRIEAMYQPDVRGIWPNGAGLTVRAVAPGVAPNGATAGGK